MKKNLICLLLALALTIACAAPVLAEGETISLMANASDANKSYLTFVIGKYEEATGNTIEVLGQDPDNFDKVAASKFANGDIPDLFQHFNDTNLNSYNVPANFLYLNDQPWVSDLTPGALAYSSDAEGNVLGLPFWESSVSGCFYNKAIFEKLGLKPATNQQEFNDLCDALAAQGVTPLCWAAGDSNWMYQFALDPVFADDGGEKLAKLNRNEITYADVPEVLAMCEWVQMAAEKGWFGDTYLTDGWSDITVRMGTGEAAMTLIWDTYFDTDFEAGYDYAKEDFGIMPVFMGTCDEGTYEGGNLNMLMVNKNGAHVDVALDFLNFCADPENYNAAFDGVATSSVFNGQTTNVPSTMVTANVDSVNALMRASTAFPKILGYTQSETGRAIQEMLMGNVDPAGAVKLMDDYRIASAKALGVEGF